MKTPLLRVSYLVLFFVLFPGNSTGEVAVNVDSAGSFSFSVLDPNATGEGGGTDPWPMVRTGVPAAWILNPNGASNVPEDGIPSFAWNPIDETYEVTWAQHDGADYEIVLSSWNVDQWTTPVSLTSNSIDDTEPVIVFAPDGTARIVYQDGTQVYILTRPPAGSWGTPDPVDLGDLPHAAGTVLDRVAYQHDAGGGWTEIVAAVNSSGWLPTVLVTTSFTGLDGTGDLDVRIQAAGTSVWIAWEHSPTSLGWSELVTGSWTAAQFEPITGVSEEEAGRIRIKQALIH